MSATDHSICNGFNACNNVTDILYNTDVITAVVKLIVHSPRGRLV